MSGPDDADANRRRYQAPYTRHHPIPTIQQFREEKQSRKATAFDDDAKTDIADPSTSEHQGDQNVANTIFATEVAQHQGGKQDERPEDLQRRGSDADQEGGGENGDNGQNSQGAAVDTSETGAAQGAKQQRKAMNKQREERAERVVTDPVTHLRVKIHDFTSAALEDIDENPAASGTTPRTATGFANKNKSTAQLKTEENEITEEQKAFDGHFPSPDYQLVHKQVQDIAKLGTTIGLIGSVVAMLLALTFVKQLKPRQIIDARPTLQNHPGAFEATVWVLTISLAVGFIIILIAGLRQWMESRISSVWDSAVWHSKFDQIKRDSKRHDPETTIWLNSLLSSLWPLINPDLFTSLADTLEDVMQASLPKVVRMVSVDDVGQGSEPLRILGIRWLPTGAAARSVSAQGGLQSTSESKKDSASQESNAKEQGSSAQSSDDSQRVAEAMEAEEGDFVNLEVAFAYRARQRNNTFKDRIKDMHIYVAFYLPGNIKLPVWVDLRGIVGTMRLRLQLAPDPPFFALCTMTFLGQPKVELSCVPLVQRGLNIMNLPLINRFVQSSIDAAMAEYVAPKSKTLDLKDMIAGDDFKKDVTARGVLAVTIIRGYDFKIGDVGIPLIMDGSADPYVSVGWAKFGKPMWSTRILENEMEPIWNETTYILVTPDELNVDERVRIQLWDSDRFSADDDLGRIEVDLKDIMRSSETNGRLARRTDGFRALKAGEDLPGKLEWKVGYFSKVRIEPGQLERQQSDPDVRSREDLEKKVDEVSRRKLREVEVKEGGNKKEQGELEMQRALELKQREDEMIISAPPPEGYPSGVFSIQIHQLTGLELQTLNKTEADKSGSKAGKEDQDEDLPSSYCTVMLNHSKVYKTRTKPKNASPFFNAGTERFIPDWQNAEVHVSVKDARLYEDDALLGIVHLPLHEVFKERSQVNQIYPISGGVGYGRIRLSMVWRSVQLQAPKELLGWQMGTLEVQPHVTAVDVPVELRRLKLKLQTSLGSAKVYASNDVDGWSASKGDSMRLAVKDRYSSCLTLRFRHKGAMHDRNAAFAIMWLREIPDEEEREMELPVWKGDFKKAIKCSTDECGERLGVIKVKMTFWSGLGAAHSKWAVKDPDLREIVEVLETARDNLETSEAEKNVGIVDDEISNSEGDDDDDSSNNGDNNEMTDGALDDRKADGKGLTKGLVDEAKDYKKHHRSIHRRNRGLTTWKVGQRHFTELL